MKNPPKSIEVNYVVTIYKDMEFADDVETADSFEMNFQAALEFYKETIDQVKNNQFVTLELEIKQEFEDKAGGFSFETVRIADNYVKV